MINQPPYPSTILTEVFPFINILIMMAFSEAPVIIVIKP